MMGTTAKMRGLCNADLRCALGAASGDRGANGTSHFCHQSDSMLHFAGDLHNAGAMGCIKQSDAWLLSPSDTMQRHAFTCVYSSGVRARVAKHCSVDWAAHAE